MKKNVISSLILVFYIFLSACRPVPASAEFAMSTQKSLGTSTPTAVLLLHSTQTALPPMIQINEKVNCYSGPGENGYQLVTTFESGERMNVIGKDALNLYWIVLDSKSNKGCWVESQYTTVQGPKEALPILIPAPTVAARPNAPGNLEVLSACYTGREAHISVILKWEDRSNNETGFVIYRNSEKLVVLDANTTQYEVENSRYWATTIHSSYEVFAFNDVGNSARAQISFVGRCP